MSYFKLNAVQTFTLNSHPRGRQHPVPITNSCNVPFVTMVVDGDQCFVCQCEAWLPIPIGSVDDFNSLEEAWSSPCAQILQQDVKSKKFTWCAVTTCGIAVNHKIQNYSITLNIDDSCNLSCPSCRRSQIMTQPGPILDKKKRDLEKVISWIDKFDKPITIKLLGSGDPFASPVLRPFFKSYVPKPTHKFQIITNGLLLKKNLEHSAITPFVDSYSISIDAGSKEVYENVRRPGKWEVLLENLDYLKDNRGSSKVMLNFIVQRDNFKDVNNFVALCNKYNFNGTLQKLRDWGTWGHKPIQNPDAWTIQNGVFEDHDVLHVDHPLHKECVNILKPLLSSAQINLDPGLRWTLL